MDGLTATHFLLEVRLRREAVPSFERYPFALPVVKALDRLEFHPQVTLLVGENGSGKSTLMEGMAVALGLNAEGGSRNFRFQTRASHSELHEFLELRRGRHRPRDVYFFRSESFFNVATEIERLDGDPDGGGPPIGPAYGGRGLHEQSHGESFFALFTNRFGGRGLYLLDEPEAALSPVRQMGFLRILHDLVGAGSQLVVATHSPIIMAYPGAWIYVLGDGEPRRVPYEQTEHYKVTREFLLRPERMLKLLLEEEGPGAPGSAGA